MNFPIEKSVIYRSVYPLYCCAVEDDVPCDGTETGALLVDTCVGPVFGIQLDEEGFVAVLTLLDALAVVAHRLTTV